MLVIFICFIFIVAAWQGAEFLEVNEKGELVLSKARQEKLDQALEDLQEGEQYALVALRKAIFPCYSCPDSVTITLFPGEVWKYGVTTKGRTGRYPSGLPSVNLDYQTQFVGTLQDCFMEERRKIFHYALLPENVKRRPPIIRPPGNKQDN